MEVHGGMKAMCGDTRVAQQKHGSRRTKIKINVARKQLDLVFTFCLDGWMIVLGTN